MAALVKVVVVLAISTGDVKEISLAFCHFVILPVLPPKVRSAGAVL